jgi:hypothetical protein
LHKAQKVIGKYIKTPWQDNEKSAPADSKNRQAMLFLC